jgi:hypothetical protein
MAKSGGKNPMIGGIHTKTNGIIVRKSCFNRLCCSYCRRGIRPGRISFSYTKNDGEAVVVAVPTAVLGFVFLLSPSGQPVIDGAVFDNGEESACGDSSMTM